MLNSSHLKLDFPILARTIHGHPLVYLDNAATSQKPQAVIDAISNYYTNHNANVHRGVHTLSDESTSLWHDSRQTIASFFGARDEELILTRNTTEAINIIAYGWADHNLGRGDVVLTSLMEHHSNLVVWQQVCARTGAQLELIPVLPNGELDMDWFDARLTTTAKTGDVRLVAISHVSNTLGTLNPIAQIIKRAHAVGAVVVVDGAQAAPHMRVNFDGHKADFYAFSGHKMLGPMGCGGLLVKHELLPKLQHPTGCDVPLPNGDGLLYPVLFGGGMIDEVHPLYARFHTDPRDRFTAGTPDVASAVGLAAACTYLAEIGMDRVEQHDRDLVEYALEKLSDVPGLTLIGPDLPTSQAKRNRVGSVAFLMDGIHAHDVAQVLDSQGIAVRSGHHCTMPLHEHFHWQATTRASFQVYNSYTDIDALFEGLSQVQKVLK